MYTCPAGKLTIGVGLNLEANPLCDHAISIQLDHDIAKATEGAKSILREDWDKLNDVRQEVLTQMVFQMGVTGVKGFRNALRCIREGNFQQAGTHMLASKWARQTPVRAKRLIKAMRQGNYD